MNRTCKTQTALMIALVLSIFLSSASLASAQGAPPTITDDPGTPGNGMWEVIFLSTMERSHSGWLFEAPVVDLNYGIGNSVQLNFEVPLVVSKETGEKTQFGLGNSTFGVKWRFLDEEKSGVDMSFHPQLEFNNPTSSVKRGLAEQGMVLVLPLQVSRVVGPVDLFAEVGYELGQFGTDNVFYGLAASRQVSKRIALAAEIHGESLRTMKEGVVIANLAGGVQLTKTAGLIFSAGRTLRTPDGEGPHFVATFGLQFSFKHGLFSSRSK